MSFNRPPITLLIIFALGICAFAAAPAAASVRSQQRAVMSSSIAIAGKKAPKHKAAHRSSEECGQIDVEARETSADSQAASTVCLLNRERTSRGLRALRVNPRLSSAAQAHTNNMVRGRYFAHVSRSDGNPLSRIRSRGYLANTRSWMIGENLAWGSGNLSSPRAIVKAWMHSPEHRANILTARFREIGIGVSFHAPVSVPGDAVTYDTTFGSRR